MLLTQHRYALDQVPYFNKVKSMALEISQKVMFEMLAYAFHNTAMSEITNSMGSIL